MKKLFLLTAIAAGLCGALLLALESGGSARQINVVSTAEADDVQGGLCGPLAYYTLNPGGVGIYGCGGPTKDAQAFCNQTPWVGGGFGPLREWYSRTCLECGEACGSYDYINPSSCSAG